MVTRAYTVLNSNCPWKDVLPVIRTRTSPIYISSFFSGILNLGIIVSPQSSVLEGKFVWEIWDRRWEATMLRFNKRAVFQYGDQERKPKSGTRQNRAKWAEPHWKRNQLEPGKLLCFCMPEETTKGVYICVMPMHGSGLPCYRLMVNSMGFCSLENTILGLATDALNFW